MRQKTPLSNSHSEALKILHRSAQSQRPVRAEVIVLVLVFSQPLIDRGQIDLSLVLRVKLLTHGSVDPLDAAVVLRAARRQDIKFNLQVLTRCFKPGHEFAAAVNLNPAYRERQLLDDLPQETSGVACGGPAVCPLHQAFRHRAYRLEVFDDVAGKQGDREMINLNQLAGLFRALPITPTFGMPAELAAALGFDLSLCVERARLDPSETSALWPGSAPRSRRWQ